VISLNEIETERKNKYHSQRDLIRKGMVLKHEPTSVLKRLVEGFQEFHNKKKDKAFSLPKNTSKSFKDVPTT